MMTTWLIKKSNNISSMHSKTERFVNNDSRIIADKSLLVIKNT